MRLTEVIDDAAGSAGYKFDLFDGQTNKVVKVFATRDALRRAITLATSERSFDLVLIEAANAKFERQELEDDGLLLIIPNDVAG